VPDPPYLRIVADLRGRIAAGDLRPGQRVPSTRQIAAEWGVALATAARALATLARDGDVRAVPRVGSVVAGPASARPTAPAGPAPSAGDRAAPRPARPKRPTRPGRSGAEDDSELSRERIVRAAIGLADAEGLAAVSMRRVATDLGVSTMSLYRHVPGKDELVFLMSDAVFGESRLPDPPPPHWRARLEGLARIQWSLCREHPWVAHTISLTRPMPVPNGMAHTEYAMRAVDGLGLDPATMVRIAITLAGHLQAIAVNLESDVEAEQETGLTSTEWMESQDALMSTIIASGPYPMLASLAGVPDVEIDLDTLFEFGLGLILDGIAALIESRSAGFGYPEPA
jgi:AcrR family transcriptional regulator